MTQQISIGVNRDNLSELTPLIRSLSPLEAEHIRVRITNFALTANNITYMVTGDMIGYWKFFDPKAYGITEDNLGRMPVWGYAQITQSRHDALPEGAQIYGFFPPADYFDLKPVNISPMGFSDGAEHRLPLHNIYNRYSLTAADPSFGEEFKDLQPILRPLFTTSFLIDDVLARENVFGAEQVLLLSASSKTALGTGFCLSNRQGLKVTGLTSERNKPFTEKTGFYNEVQSYDSLTDLNPDIKTVIVDMAGNGAVTQRLYEHFEENIVYNCMVGKSHWDGAPPHRPAAGAPPVMFFAPDQAKLRLKDWGPAGFAQKLGERWTPFCRSAQTWMEIETHNGAEAFAAPYHALLRGDIQAHKGLLMSL